MKNKQLLKDIFYLIKKIDYFLIYTIIFFIMYFALDYSLAITFSASYIYASFYYLLRKIILAQEINFLHIFYIFVIGIFLIPGGMFSIINLLAKGA